MEEQILAVDLSTEQTIDVNLPEQDNIAQIDVYWQDEVVLDLDASLMYIVSGQQEIQDYVDNKSKPEIDGYIQDYAKPIVSEVVDQIATPVIDEYFENTVKPSITEFAEEEMAGYAATATAQAEIATEKANEASETAKIVDEKVQEFSQTTEASKNEFVNFAQEKTEEFEQTAITATEQAVGSAERSRIWADGEQEEVQELGGELSSKGWADLAQEKANNAKTSADRAEKIAQGFDGVVNTIEGSIGDIGFAPLGIDEAQNKRRYLNGQVISQAQFKSFTNKIKAAIELTPNLATSETNWQAEVTNSVLGQCGKFVIDDETGTIRLPKVVNINGLQDLALMGSIKAESLPNIKGYTGAGRDSEVYQTGPFYRGGTGKTVGQFYSSTSGHSAFIFDASRSSSTYQDNAPVQQEAIQYPYFIQVATGVEESVDVTREIELNNPFSLLDYKWSEYELNNASWLLSNGQFNSGATYISVYNLLLEIYNGTTTKDGVSVKLSTEAYTDTDFVLNTSDTTFRLPVKVKLASGNAVVGNGMTLGLTIGTENAGMFSAFTYGSSNTSLNAKVNLYGTNAGVYSGGGSGATWTDKTVGITTDPEKSGLVLADNDMYLYFYVGETIQDANVIAASQVLTTVADCVRKSSATDRETVVGWGMPDYSAGIAKTVSTTNQTVGSFGLLEVRMQFTSGTHKFYINDIEKTLQSGNGGTITHWLFYNVSPNDTFRFSSTNSGFSVMFYPFKGVN
jgi:hypothetical protein